MNELKQQLISALLVVLTAAGLVSAGINFQQQRKFHLPEDGVTWVDRSDEAQRTVVKALHIMPASGAERAGVKAGDRLLRINGYQIDSSLDVIKALVRLGAWKSAEYILERDGIEIRARVIIRERVTQSALYYQYAAGLSYLAIGLFVYFRRGRAPRATHFFVLCLVSFILCTFHYTGKLNSFDKVIYWGNVAAGLLVPAVFLHFCLRFPEPHKSLRHGWLAPLIYSAPLALLGVYAGLASGTLRVAVPLVELRWMLDRLWLAFLAAGYLTGAAVLTWQNRRHCEDPVQRQQIKWLRNGALIGIVPFAAVYVVPYMLGVVPDETMNMAVLFLILVPLTWAYAILRYRLMDVDLIFQQGYAYTLATLAVLGIFYGMILSLGPFEDLPAQAVVILIVIATFIFQPIRNWIQEQLDRHWFYKDRFDYRRTLAEFARELAAETDLDSMLHSVADRLVRTLSLQHLAFFLAYEEKPGFYLRMVAGGGDKPQPSEPLDLSFLEGNSGEPLFFERTRNLLDAVHRDWPAPVRQSIARLGFTYYMPCTVRGRTIAYLGVGRTGKGDFLTSEDLELLVSLCGSIAIAIENARLYRSLQRKVEEYERLKEFSENIVESINVGILAADLDDRVESWNSQLEQLTGIGRQQAVGRRLSDLFPARLAATFEQMRGEDGIHHVYKYAYLPAERNGHGQAAGNGGGNGNGHLGGGAVREAVLNIAVAPLVTKDMERIGRIIIFDDITERSELEQRLMQADKLSSIGLLAAGVAHEVNTPLAVISTYAQMLAKQVGGDEAKSRLLEKIAKQTFRASEIVNSLLNFSRTSKSDFDSLDLNRTIRETVSLIEHQLATASVNVELALDERLPPARGNTGKIQQVFLNLFLNAKDAMEGGGTLTVRSFSGEDAVRVSISDTGGGIPPEDLPRIYDPFFTTKGARKGTGLGLSVSYGIMREHGGSIEVQSAPGAGTTFLLEFPLARKPVHA